MVEGVVRDMEVKNHEVVEDKVALGEDMVALEEV